MIVGCVKEIKNNEFRVGLTPDNVKAYVQAGHRVLMEAGAGFKVGKPLNYAQLDRLFKPLTRQESRLCISPSAYARPGCGFPAGRRPFS